GRAFYSRYPTTHFVPPAFVCARVAPGGVVLPDSVGILSIDVDGDDYAIWEGIVSRPWIVIIEARVELASGVDASGASVAALTELASRKGYFLAARNRHGYNLIFIRSDLEGSFPPLAAFP